jgi:hypothetical protein
MIHGMSAPSLPPGGAVAGSGVGLDATIDATNASASSATLGARRGRATLGSSHPSVGASLNNLELVGDGDPTPWDGRKRSSADRPRRASTSRRPSARSRRSVATGTTMLAMPQRGCGRIAADGAHAAVDRSCARHRASVKVPATPHQCR